jgi:dipeptidyl aminopeptidase/acylaminoacyl peptidase
VQPADIGRLVGVSDLSLSPDGRWAAFVVTRVDMDANRYRRAVWLAATDGSAPPYPFTGGDNDTSPAWSPDGRRLAFTRNVERGGATLLVSPVDGPGETVTLCERDEAIDEPVWSPDGTRIAFASRERTGRYRDGDDERARPPRHIERLFVRLDGAGWIVDRPRSVLVVPADGTAAARIVAGGPYEHSGFAWSPDGRTLAVTTSRGKDRDLELIDDVHLIDVDQPGEEPQALTRRDLSHAHPAFSPDGASIATLAVDNRLIPSHGQVAVLDVATGEQRILTAGLDRQCMPFPGARAPIWDGEDLLFSVENHGDVHVYRVPSDGSQEPSRVLGGRRAIMDYDLADGVLAFIASTPTTLAEVFVLADDGAERQLTRLGVAFIDAVPPSDPEHFTVPSPAGDVELDAWIVRPPDVREGERLPVLLSIHGGPMTQYSNGWFEEFQMWTGAGYAVVYTNPHGSSGHTEAFLRAIRSPEAAALPGTGWGGIDADDVLAVLDAALARDASLDPDRVGVLGGSYGGYLTSWLVGRTDRFVAACSERAVNDMESEEVTSDLAGSFHYEVGVTHLDAPEVYRRISPITYVRDIHTPLLIIHSENDLRCHVEQADRLFVALRMLGRTVEYWRFPEEGHELSRSGSPRHRRQRAEIILDWFGRHLGGRRPKITWDHPSRA